LKAAKIAADAAKTSADTANQTMLLSHYAALSMADWRVEVEMGPMLPRSLNIDCFIRNVGTVYVRVESVETNHGWDSISDTIAQNIIIHPHGEHPYRFTIDCGSLRWGNSNRAGGTIFGRVRYQHHYFGRRRCKFEQLFWVETSGQAGIGPMEGAGNNDEADTDQDQQRAN